MTRYSLPIKRLDGSVMIEPLHSRPAHRIEGRPQVRSHRIAFNNTEVQRGKIFRDIAILALLAITIIAGSAVLIGMLWRDVSIAESQARIVVAEQEAASTLAKTELLVASDERRGQEVLSIALVGFVIVIILLVLMRPSVIIGR